MPTHPVCKAVTLYLYNKTNPFYISILYITSFIMKHQLHCSFSLASEGENDGGDLVGQLANPEFKSAGVGQSRQGRNRWHQTPSIIPVQLNSLPIGSVQV